MVSGTSTLPEEPNSSNQSTFGGIRLQHSFKQDACPPTHVSYSAPDGTKEILRLPVTGIQSAHMLLDEANGKSNEMMGHDWGIITDNRESHDPTEFM